MRLDVVALALVLFALHNAAEAQPAATVPRIGVLMGGTRDVERSAFLQGLLELGYAEGKNIVIEWRTSGGNLDRVPDLANELVRLKVDVIVASSNPAIIALKQATSTIPIVMSSVGDPVGAGFVQSLARPGGNVTGLSNLAEGLSAKRVELLKEAVPHASLVAVLRHPAIPTHTVLLRETQSAASMLKMKLVSFDIRGPDEFDNTFDAMARSHPHALIVLPEPTTFVHRARIVSLAAKHRLPAMYLFDPFVELAA
jgi:putative ABC transport system substrate-binding protein